MKSIDVFEHGRLLIGEYGFEKNHWNAFVKLNTLHNDAYFQVLHNGLKFKQYVGVIQVDGLSISIHPKADKADRDEKWKDVLLQMLKSCGKLKADTADAANLRKQHINLLEVYFQFYLKEVEALVRQGLVKKYRRESGNVKALKGKLEFASHIRLNLVHQERFYTSHQVYDVDHSLHQVLAYALDIIGHFSKGTHLNDQLKRVRLSFPEVKQIHPTAQTLATIKIDRKTAPYERALELAKFIILNYSPDIHHGQQKMIALLFDMNQLWEEYVLKSLRTYARTNPVLNIEVSGQESMTFYDPSRTIRPDIVIRKGKGIEQEIIVIDTKWKLPQDNRASIEDLKQMYAYGRFWNSRKLMLLYPGDDQRGMYREYPNCYDGDEKHTCKTSYVSVLNENGILDTTIAEKIITFLM